MSVLEQVIGVGALLVFLMSVLATAVRLRSALLPALPTVARRLAELVLAHVVVLVQAQALGLLGQLGRWQLLASALVVAVAVTRQLQPHQDDPGHAGPRPDVRRWPALAAVLALALVAAQWLVTLPATARTGVLGVDALHYRLTFAAHFAQSGSTTELQRVSSIDVSTYYPKNDELLHAVGQVLLGSDTLSLVLPLLGLVGAVLAVWVLGEHWGSGPLAVLALCLPLSLTGREYLPTVGNDWAAAWPLVAALAFLLLARARGTWSSPELLLIGLAGGLAVGTKVNVLPPAAVVLVAAVLLAGRGRRLRALGLLLAGHLLVAGYWFVRNLIAVGNPFPYVPVELGPFSLPRPPMAELDAVSFSVLDYATDRTIVREWFLPGVKYFFGPGWWLLILLIGAGLVLGLMRRDAGRRTVALVGLVSALSYLTTATSAGGLPGMPILFAFNIRYALVALVLGVVLLATTRPAVRRPGLAAGLLLVVFGVTHLQQGAWARGWPGEGLLLTGGLLLVAAVAVPLVRSGRRRVTLTALTVLAVALGLTAQASYLESRYTTTEDDRQRLFASLQDVEGARIGVVGFPLQYPFFGAELENEVEYVGRLGDDDGFSDYPTCRDFRRGARGFDYLVLQYRGPEPAVLSWARTDPSAQELLRTPVGSVFRLTGPLDPARC